MEKPSLFDITQSALAIIVVIGAGLMVILGSLPIEPFVALVAMVLGFYFGRQSGESVKSLAMTLWAADPNPPSLNIPEEYHLPGMAVGVEAPKTAVEGQPYIDPHAQEVRNH